VGYGQNRLSSVLDGKLVEEVRYARVELTHAFSPGYDVVDFAPMEAPVFLRIFVLALFAGEPLKDAEIALAQFGARVRTGPNTIEIDGGHELRGSEFSVPGDASSAAFFVAAALAVSNSKLRLANVGLNPTRTGFLRLLQEMQAKIEIVPGSDTGAEPVGEIVVETSDIAGMEIGGHWIPNVIDEIPMLAILGTRTRNGIRIRDAAELRAKESDRIHSVATNLRVLGARVEEYPDGLFVPGQQRLVGGVVDSFGDHRIAMAFAVAGLFAAGPVVIKDPACAAVSFPSFYDLLNQVRA